MINGKIGVEVECLVKQNQYDKIITLARNLGWNFGGDGSIRGAKSGEQTIEFKSKVYQISEIDELFTAFSQISEMIRVNSSCGLHIHLSFEKTSDYYKLYNYEFIKQFQEMIKTTFKTQLEKKRLTNDYCAFYNSQESFIQDSTMQLKSMQKGGNRYKAINFNSVNLYNTIEFRIYAPTSKLIKFKSYINNLVKNIENHLAKPLAFQNIVEILAERRKRHSEGQIIIREIIRKEEISHV